MKKFTNLVAILALLCGFAVSAEATSFIKANNTTALNLAASYTANSGTPTSADTVTWDSTVTAANTVALGGNLSMLGIIISNPGGAVVVTEASGNVLTLGTSGINMSAASQNLTLLNSAVAGNIAISGNQVWNIASGRTLTLFVNNNTLNQRLTGSGNIEITGGGIVRLLTGDAGSTTFTAGNGNDTFSGNWTMTSGSVRGLRNGTHAWGQGTITLNGATLGQEQGGWTWANNIILNTATTSTLDDFNGSGTTRSLKLQGVISGDGNLNINDSSSRMNNDNGFILTGANTLSGTVTLGASADLRIGGVPGNDTTLGAGSSGTLGTASVNLNATTATLTLSRNNTWTFGNTLSGAGALRIGGAVSGASAQVVTLTGNNTHSGATTISVGKMIGVTGGSCANSAVTVSSGATIGVKLNTAGGTWGCSTLTLSSTATTGEFDFNNKVPSTTTAPLQVSGNVLNSGTLNVTILNGIFAATDYPLIKTTGGTLTPGTLGTVTIGGGAAATLTSDSTTIYLHVTTATPVTYYWGVGTGTWDTTTANWNNAADGSSTVNYADGQPTIFDDTSSGTAPFTVTLNTTVNPGALTVNNPTKDYTISGSGAIAGSTGLTKSGAGKLTLSTANTFSGATTVSGGTLSVSSDGNLGTAPGSATAGSLVLNGSTLSASSGFTLNANRGLALGPTSGSGSGTIDVATSQTLAYGGIAANNGGTGSLTKTGNGTLTLSGANTYSGSTTVSAGTLAVSGGSAIPNSGTVSIANSATFTVNATETIGGLSTVAGSTVDAASGTLTFTTGSILGNLTGSGAILRNGTSETAYGQFTAAGTLAFNGTLQLRGSTPSASPSIMASSATGRFWLHSTTGSQAAGTAFALDTGASTTDAQDFIIGEWDATSGNRKLTLSSLTGYGTVRTDAGETGTRALVVDQSSGDTTFNGMLLSHTSGAGAVRSLAFEKKGSSKLTMAGIIGKETLSAGAANADVAITVSAGTLELAAANTTTGPISVNGGTLALGASGTIANVPTITVAHGAVFDVSAVSGGFTLGAGQTLKGNGAVTGPINALGTITPGTSIGTLTINGTTTLGGVIVSELDRNNAQKADKIVFGSPVTFGGTLTVVNAGATLQTGDVFDLFDGSLSGTFTTLNLPGGAGHWNSTDLNVGGTITFIGNNPVNAANFALGVSAGGSATVNVVGKFATDADTGDVITITTTTTPSHGTVSIQGGNLVYTSTGSATSDSFNYTVGDGLSTATATVTVSITASTGSGANIISLTPGSGTADVQFAGIPGAHYAIERSVNLTTWTEVAADVTVPGNGIMTWTDASAPSTAYYRTRYVSGP